VLDTENSITIYFPSSNGFDGPAPGQQAKGRQPQFIGDKMTSNDINYLSVRKIEGLFRSVGYKKQYFFAVNMHYKNGTVDFFEKYTKRKAAIADARKYFPGIKIK
jgi:hypothetical protein